MENLEREAKEIYLRALEATPAERAEVVVTLGRNRANVLERVRQLLFAHEHASRAIASGAVAGIASEEPATIPAHIGAYRIVRKIGMGGMGVVYEAEQSKPKRTVALKVIRPGWASKEMLVRFEYEAELLARLQHPGIAQVFEAGTFATDSGVQPYFAMELVRGKPLNEYADEQGLGTRERLALVVSICEALHHAHQKGVIHRDLKPGNILVTDDGRPKILDFGVARLTNSDMQATTVHTEIGQILGTLPYMSPEQFTGDPKELDTRSDVYTLGVVVYELLAAQLPHNLTTKMIHEAARVVQEDEPARLGTINAALSGDVETIVSRAMEKDKDRRYQSALDLSSDISRFLRDEPITARPATAWYQLRKFASRNRALVSAIGLAGFALSVTAGIAVAKAIEARNQTKLAEAETQRAAEQTKAAEVARAVADRRAVEAEQARAEAQRNLGLSYSSAAAVASQKGSWIEALAAADSALQSGAPDVSGLKLLRIDALAGLDRLDEAFAEAAKLESAASDESTKARALLWRGELSMGSIVPAAAKTNGESLVRRALKLGLPPAEDAYARALLSTKWDDAYAHFSKAVALNPFNVRAQLMLALIETLGGKTDDATRRVMLARTLAPNSAQPMVAAAIVAIASGNQELYQQSREGFRMLGHPEIGNDLDAAAGAVADLRSILRARNADNASLNRILTLVTALAHRSANELKISAVRPPTGLFWGKQADRMIAIVIKAPAMIAGFTNLDELASTFDEFGPGLRCIGLFVRAKQAANAGRHADVVRLCDELFQAPTALVDVRPLAREYRLAALSFLQESDAKFKEELHRSLRSTAVDPDSWPPDRLNTFIKYSLNLGDGELAHAFLSRWESDHGPSPDFKLAKARVALSTKDYTNAARVARELLAEETEKKGPAAEAMRKEEHEILDEASEKMLSLVGDFQAAPADQAR